MKFISISEASKVIGVTEKTLRIWDKYGKLKASKTTGGHRRYETKNLLEFLKTYKKYITTEFANADLLKENKNKKEFDFWKKKEYVQSEKDEPLSLILTNLIKNYSFIDSDLPLPEKDNPTFWLEIAKKIWQKDITHNFVSWNILNRPCDIIYYTTKTEQNNVDLEIKTEMIAAKTRVFDFQFMFPSEPEELIFLDPENW